LRGPDNHSGYFLKGGKTSFLKLKYGILKGGKTSFLKVAKPVLL